MDEVWTHTTRGSPVRMMYALQMIIESMFRQKDLTEFFKGCEFNLAESGWLNVVKKLLEDFRKQNGEGPLVLIDQYLMNKHMSLKKGFWSCAPIVTTLPPNRANNRTSPLNANPAGMSSDTQSEQATLDADDDDDDDDDDGDDHDADADTQNAATSSDHISHPKEDSEFVSAIDEGIGGRFDEYERSVYCSKVEKIFANSWSQSTQGPRDAPDPALVRGR